MVVHGGYSIECMYDTKHDENLADHIKHEKDTFKAKNSTCSTKRKCWAQKKDTQITNRQIFEPTTQHCQIWQSAQIKIQRGWCWINRT